MESPRIKIKGNLKKLTDPLEVKKKNNYRLEFTICILEV